MTTTLDLLADADRWIAGVPLVDVSTVCAIGLGGGRLLDVLDRRGWRGSVVALVPESVPRGGGVEEGAAIAEWLRAGRLAILQGPEYAGIDRALAEVEWPGDAPVIVVDPAVGVGCREGAVHAARAIGRAWFGVRANREAKRQHGGRCLLNTLRNLHAIAGEGDVAALAGAYARVPAVVVGAGPSLDLNLSDLARFQDRALIIAADTALRPLLGAGITPALVVALDPTETNGRHLAGLPPCPDTHLVAEGSIDPEAVRGFSGRTFFFDVSGHDPWPWLAGAGLGRGRLRAWGSVLTAAFDLALAMGCDPVIFAGADLAFTGGQPYARGTTYEEDWSRAWAWGRDLDRFWADVLAAWPDATESDVHGRPVRTTPHLRSFRDWIAAEAGRLGNRTIVNGTGGGILVGPGIQQQPLDVVLSRLPPVESIVRARIAEAWKSASREPRLDPSTLVVSDEVRRAWTAGAGVSADAIDAALRQRRPVVAVPRPSVEPAIAPAPAAPARPGLSVADAAWLAEVERSESVRLVTLADPSHDVLAMLRRASAGLAPGETVVVVDELGTSSGAQVRRALDALLVERCDLWLEYRRFADLSSRLSVVRGGAALRTPAAGDVDAAKWEASHQAVADDLAPVLIEALAPASLVDVGCGAGFWVRAAARAGVATVAGITPRPADAAAALGLMRAPLDMVPDLGRRFDVCLCLEVAHQMAPAAQDAAIAACTRLSDTVVFSSRIPGFPGAGPHDRPMWYWAEKFFRHGYVGDDGLRAAIEERWGPARSVFEAPVVFRRRCSPAQAADPTMRDLVVDAARRAYDAWVQSVWWAIAASAHAVRMSPPCPRSPEVVWPIPSARLAAGPESLRVFAFRTDEARFYLAHAATPIRVLENGHPLPAFDDVAALAAAAGGGWVRGQDEVTIKASDGSDPRANGWMYAIALPRHVAAAETRPFDARREGLP